MRGDGPFPASNNVLLEVRNLRVIYDTTFGKVDAVSHVSFHVNEKEFFLLNKSTPIESLTSILARELAPLSDDVHLKPAVREFIEKEIKAYAEKNDFNLKIDY